MKVSERAKWTKLQGKIRTLYKMIANKNARTSYRERLELCTNWHQARVLSEQSYKERLEHLQNPSKLASKWTQATGKTRAPYELRASKRAQWTKPQEKLDLWTTKLRASKRAEWTKLQGNTTNSVQWEQASVPWAFRNHKSQCCNQGVLFKGYTNHTVVICAASLH